MKNLFVIDGAAGTGKSDLLRYITRERKEIGVLMKVTTRDKREEEDAEGYILDLDFAKDKFVQLSASSNFYSYGYGDNQYGFEKSELEKKLSLHNNVFVIIRNNELVKTLRKDFPEIRIIFAYIFSDKIETEKRLRELGYDDEKIERRLKRNDIAWNAYIQNSSDYDEIIINNSNEKEYQILIKQLIDKYNVENHGKIEISNSDKFDLIKPLIGRKDDILRKLKKYKYEKNVFLMMGFRKYNEQLYRDIEGIIKGSDFNCVRADMPQWNITREVSNPIAVLYACKYGIALFDKPEDADDMRNQYNPNVAYELGMMHLQLKDCLILKHKSLGVVPFDIIRHLYKEYEYANEAISFVKEWIGNIGE